MTDSAKETAAAAEWAAFQASVRLDDLDAERERVAAMIARAKALPGSAAADLVARLRYRDARNRSDCSDARWATLEAQRAADAAACAVLTRWQKGALLRLAVEYGHGWAEYVPADGDWDYQTICDAMSAAENAEDFGRPTAGIRPGRRHTTGTGRLTWSAELDGTIRVSVSRPTPNGSLTVLIADVTEGGSPAITVRPFDGVPIEARHADALYRALDAIEGSEHQSSWPAPRFTLQMALDAANTEVTHDG
jgi:hypothetical protein